MRVAILILSLAGLVACGPSAPEPPQPETLPAAQPSPAPTGQPTIPDGGSAIVDPAALVGEYRVAGIDGGEVEGDMGIALSITEDTLSYEPRCLGFAWTWQMDQSGALLLKRDPAYRPQRERDGTTVSCLPAVTPAFAQLATALDSAKRAARTPANGIVLYSEAHSVTLFSQ